MTQFDTGRKKARTAKSTYPKKKAGFRIPKTVVWLMKLIFSNQFFKSSFVVKVQPFG